jgi:DMSO/TMAO reductase YedYZ molybdopterin-dependent catalytic subunit
MLRRRGSTELHLARLGARATARPANPTFAAIGGLTPRITPVPDFYVVDEAMVDPVLDPMTWKLAVGGSVRAPFSLSFDDLMRLPAVERYQTLECISDPVGGGLISTARWEGIPLAEILDRAGLEPGAVEVVFRSADGYSDSLPIGQALDERTIVAVGMNGYELPTEHGFPARLLSLGTYGMKNPKWLTAIEVVDRPYTGFWETRGWSKAAVVKTGCRIDVPAQGTVVHGETAVAGIAFSGDRGISAVQVSTDGGRTWSDAVVEEPLSPSTWVRWMYRWVPRRSGAHTLKARAFDNSGVPQAGAWAPPHPNGASGYPEIAVRARVG